MRAKGCLFPVPQFAHTPILDLIALVGKLSVVTYLHELAHARGYDERQAVKWSVNLFRKVFPRSFARCQQEGHLLTTNNTAQNTSENERS
jgi:hypothetical protein